MKKNNSEKPNQLSNETVKQLLTISAHQLRSPISTIQTQLKTILGGYAGEISGKIKRLLDGAYEKSEDMLELLNDLLEIAKIEDKNIKNEFKPVDLESVFTEVYEGLAVKAELKKIDYQLIKKEDFPVVWGYGLGLKHIFNNLIENAVKYTPKNGRIVININYNKKKSILTGEITDTGIGISEEDSKKIFQEFYRAKNAKKEEKLGTGLGLVIVKKAIHIHKGKIKVSSRIGKGTSFIFRIPLVRITSKSKEKKLISREKEQMKIVIIGGRTAGPKAAAKARRMDENAEITIIEKDKLLSYAGCGLPYYISGMVEDPKELMTTNDGDIRDPDFFRKIKGINIMNKTEALKIDRSNKQVHIKDLQNGAESAVDYDKLLLATGSKANVPDIKGITKKKIYSLLKVSDADGLRQELHTPEAKDIVIIGGGLIGIETAEALSKKGARVTIIENSNQILSFLDKEFSYIIKNYFESRGVRIVLNKNVDRITGDDTANGVMVNGKKIPADLIILSAGVIPEVTLAEKAKLKLGKTGAIEINEYLQTSDPDIYAVGDCVENRSLITGEPIYTPLGSIANRQGRAAGMNITGSKEKFEGVLRNVILKAFNYNIAAVGLNLKQAFQAGFEPVSAIVPGPDREHYFPGAKLIYLKIIADRKTKRIIGAQAIGRGEVSKRIDVLAMAISNKLTMLDISKLDLAYAPPYSSPMDLVITGANVLKNKFYKSFVGISPVHLRERLDNNEDMLILDVRTPSEFDRLSIPGSILVPLYSLRGRLHSLPKDREIIICCKSGVNSYEAYRLLKANDFKDIKILEGGILTFYGE